MGTDYLLVDSVKIETVSTVCMCAKSLQVCPTLCNPMDCCPPGSGKNTEVGSHALLQGIFPTQELNLGPASQVDSLPTEL